MKIIKNLLVALFVVTTMVSCNAQTDENTKAVASGENVDVYYFHYSRRCATCNAVESVSKNTIETKYAEKFKAGTITFQSINLDEDSSKELAEKLKVSGQSLLIFKGDKKVDITNEGFMYARTNPEKLEKKIVKEISSLLK